MMKSKKYWTSVCTAFSIATAAVEQPGLIERLLKEFGTRKIDIAILSEGGKVSIKGGATPTEFSPLELAMKMVRIGVSRILYGERENGDLDKSLPYDTLERTCNKDRCSNYSPRGRLRL